MIKVVFDTNTIISASMSSTTISRLALEKAFISCKLIATEDTILELAEVLFRKKFDKYVSQEKRQSFFFEYIKIIELVNNTVKILECRDPKDNKFLEASVSGSATILITGDDDLLTLNPFRGVQIMNSRQFLELYLN